MESDMGGWLRRKAGAVEWQPDPDMEGAWMGSCADETLFPQVWPAGDQWVWTITSIESGEELASGYCASAQAGKKDAEAALGRLKR